MRCHNARFVAGAPFTKAPLKSAHSRVAFLKEICTILFLAELNELNGWVTDIDNVAQTDKANAPAPTAVVSM